MTRGAGDAPLPLGLAPISLAALSASASLSVRVERKYVLTRAVAETVGAAVRPDARVLEIDGRRSFGYATVYFDTPGLAAYLATARHRRRSFKVRTREYLDSGRLFVEVKTRRGRFTVKDRRLCDRADRLTEAAAAYVGECLGAACIPGIDTLMLAPVLRTSYRRTTLYLPESGSRVTFDSGLALSTSVGAASGRALAFPELVVVETKTAGAPTSVDRLLWALGVRPTRFSKFGTGLASVRPELPHTRWTRVMRTRLAGGGRPAMLAA